MDTDIAHAKDPIPGAAQTRETSPYVPKKAGRRQGKTRDDQIATHHSLHVGETSHSMDIIRFGDDAGQAVTWSSAINRSAKESLETKDQIAASEARGQPSALGSGSRF